MIVNIEIYPTEFLVDISALPTVFNVEISQGGGGGGGGTTVTKTSDLTNDGEDGVNAFITEKDIPAPIDISSKADKTACNLSAGNILSWQEALQINYLQNALADEITARENADIAEANARTFADGILDGKITTEKNRNNAQDAEINFLKNKPQLISTDDSILIEENDIGAMLSFFYEEFSNQDILLSFTPMVILGVYKNGLLLNDDEFILVLPKNIVINNYTTNDKIKIQYQHLKTDLYEYNISN